MQIKLKQGVVLGKEEISFPSKNTYFSFLGIPYAEPPVECLRFQAPQPHKGWNGILDATRKPKMCVQRDMLTNGYEGSEDCLFINVHIPENPTTIQSLKPVMVYVHGGAFMLGSGDAYSAEFLMEYDIILVTLNYRLHVLGFLNLGLPECPGNVGLRDQVMALKWVQENIGAFGGDNSNVTIFGESAGSSSVHYLMMSPMVRGLFNRAILQSGNARCPWAFAEDPLTCAFKIGSFLGYTGHPANRKELLEFLLKIPAVELARAQNKCIKALNSGAFYTTLPFTPSVEFDIHPSQAFLPDKPEILMKKMTPVSVMSGLNDLEGLIMLEGNVRRFMLDLSSESRKLVPPEWQKITEVLPDVAVKIQNFYFPNEKVISMSCFQQLVNILTDVQFSRHFYDIPITILNKDASTPVYLYKFSYEGKLNFLKTMCLLPFDNCNLVGSCHGDDFFYLFKWKKRGIEIPDDSYESEKKMIDLLCRLWTNFAKYGTPSPTFSDIQWTPTSVNKPCYLHINNVTEMKNGMIDEERLKFWILLTAEVKSMKNSIKQKL